MCLLMLALYPDFGTDPRRVSGAPSFPTFDLPEIFGANDDNLPEIPNLNRLKRGDVWIGETPCGPEIYDVPETLPGLGSRQKGDLVTKSLSDNTETNFLGATTHIYKTPKGSRLRLVKPQVQYYDATGQTFRDVRRDLQTRKPLDKSEREDGRFTLGHIQSPSQTNYRYSRLGPKWRDGDYRIVAESFLLTSAYEITLPRWIEYNKASAADKSRWDDLFCMATHHELGHLRIQLDLLAETLEGYENLSGPTSEAFTDAVSSYSDAVSERIQNRQDLYHIYNDGGVKRGMIELPYAELPFPWLIEMPEDKLVETIQTETN